MRDVSLLAVKKRKKIVMKNNQELIVPIDPNLMNGAMLGLVIMLIPIGALTGLYATVRYYLVDTIYYPLSYLLLGAPIFFSLIFLLILWGTFCFPKKGDPIAILNQDGIWHYRFGFISWKKINEFEPYSYWDTPEVIGIRVRDNKKISKQSSVAGKLDFFWAKLMGYPPIRIVGIVLKNEEVISFAKQFLNN